MPATAVLDIMSGLPNPQWMLAPDVARQICDFILSTQPLSNIPLMGVPDLGYRGLLVDLPDCHAADTTMRVFNGLVKVGNTVFPDREHHIEHLLLDSAGGAVDANLIEYVRNSLK